MAIYSDSGFITARDTPLIRPTLDLNFAKDKRLDSRVTFTRASSATYTDELGVIRTVPNNVPRFDHDPVTGESLGLLIEESRTNLVPYSEDFSNTSHWATTFLSVSSNVAIAPDGTMTADKLVDDTNDTFHFISNSLVLGTESVSFTCYLKAAEITQASLFLTQGGNNGMDVNLTNGSFSVSGAGNTGEVYYVGNGWYRCIIKNDGSGDLYNGIRIGPNRGALTTYQGDGNSGIYVWGAQVEKGSFATSYIPTSGSTVTRAADIASITGTNFTDFYNSSEGTLYLEAIGKGTGNSGSNGTLQVDDGFYNNRIGLINDDESAINSFITVNSSQTNFNASPSFTTGVNKNVIAYKSGDNATSLNGSTLVTNTSITTLPTVNTLRLGSNADGNSNNTIRRAIYYPKRLPNDQLQALTS